MIQNYFRMKLKVSLCMWYTVYRDAKKKVDGLSILFVKAIGGHNATEKSMFWIYYSIKHHSKCSSNLFSSIPGIKFNKQCSCARNMHFPL